MLATVPTASGVTPLYYRSGYRKRGADNGFGVPISESVYRHRNRGTDIEIGVLASESGSGVGIGVLESESGYRYGNRCVGIGIDVPISESFSLLLT